MAGAHAQHGAPPVTVSKDGRIVLSAPHDGLRAGAPACGRSVQSSPCPHGGSRPS